MIKYYLTMAVASMIVVGAIIYAFTITGSPFEQRSRKLDQKRVADITDLSRAVEDYYRENNKLPEKLREASKNLYRQNRQTDVKDPETNQEYEYSTTGFTTYKICAEFATASDQEIDRLDYYYDKKFEHPKGHYCFDLEVPDWLIKDKSRTPVEARKIEDEKIASATTDAKNIGSSDFPYAFFNHNITTWGLINYAHTPVTVTINFKEPAKIKNITNVFTHCPVGCIYNWSAEGTTKDNKTVSLIGNVIADPKVIIGSEMESKQEINSNEEFTTIKISATRGGTDQQVHWKKIWLEYK